LLSFEQALRALLEGAVAPLPERVAVGEADGRVLVRDLLALSDLPGWDHSTMDGYAVSVVDLVGDGPWILPVEGESRTGHDPPEHRSGTACRIFTGARIPRGADAVVIQEQVVREADTIRLDRRVESGAWIRHRGDDLRAGGIALEAGTRLSPGHLALAASADATSLWVARRPVVTIVSTGDELRHAGEPAVEGKLPESGSVAIAAMARRAGAWVRVAPAAPDDLEETRARIEQASRGTDLLVTIGGVSVGDHDVVRPALEAAGYGLEFWRVRMKPGKPLAVGRNATARALCLPGNPTSAQVTFALFGMPLLRAMQGDAAPVPPRVCALVDAPLKASSDRLEFVRARLDTRVCPWRVHPLRNQASGATTSMAHADCLAVISPERGAVAAGSEVEVIRLADL